MRTIAAMLAALFMAASLAAKDNKAATYTEDQLAAYEVQIDLAAIKIWRGADPQSAGRKSKLTLEAAKIVHDNFQILDERNPVAGIVAEQFAALFPDQTPPVRIHIFRSLTTFVEGVRVETDLYLPYESVHQLADMATGRALLLATIAHELGHSEADFIRLRLIDSQSWAKELKETLRARLEMRADVEAARLLQNAKLDPKCLVSLLTVLNSRTNSEEDQRLHARLTNVEEFLKSRAVATIGSR